MTEREIPKERRIARPRLEKLGRAVTAFAAATEDKRLAEAQWEAGRDEAVEGFNRLVGKAVPITGTYRYVSIRYNSADPKGSWMRVRVGKSAEPAPAVLVPDNWIIYAATKDYLMVTSEQEQEAKRYLVDIDTVSLVDADTIRTAHLYD